MSDESTTATTAEAAPSGELTTASNPWELRAQTFAEDLHVQVTDPLFDGQAVKAIIQEPELTSADGDGNGEAVKLGFQIQEELVDTLGHKKAPGFIWRPSFGAVIKPASADKADQAERGLRDLSRLVEAAGVLPKRSSHQAREIVSALGKVAGKEILIKFSIRKGKQRDEETGEFKQFQNARFASPSAEGEGTGTTAASVDY